MAAELKTMLKRFGMSNLECEVRLLLKPECVTPVLLRANLPAVDRLGWGTFLTATPGLPGDGEVRYRLPLHIPRQPARTLPNRAPGMAREYP